MTRMTRVLADLNRFNLTTCFPKETSGQKLNEPLLQERYNLLLKNRPDKYTNANHRQKPYHSQERPMELLKPAALIPEPKVR